MWLAFPLALAACVNAQVTSPRVPGTDAGPDAGTAKDAGEDAGSSSTTDAGPDAGVEADAGATIAVTPPSATVVPSGTASFSCTVTGLSDVRCSWSVQEGASGGSVSATGLYTAPSAAGVYHVIAASVASPTLTAAATVVVPATVGDCTSLAAVGVVENITPPDFRTPANLETFSVVVNPQQPNIVFAAGGNITNGAGCPAGQTCPQKSTGVYVSTDCGKTFNPLSMGPGGAFASGNLWNIKIDPVHPNNMYLMNGYGGPPTLFKSTDSGATWTNLFTDPIFTTPRSQGGMFNYGGFARSFDIEAGNPSHLVVAFHEDCYGAVAAAASDAVNGAVMCLAETRDGGATWSFFEGPILPGGGDGGAPIILSGDLLVYANPGDNLGNTLWFTSDHNRVKSSWKAVGTYNQTGPFYAVNQSGAYFDPGGTVYLPGGNGVVYSAPGPTWGQAWVVAGTGGTLILSGDGRAANQGGTLFSSFREPGGVYPINAEPLTNLSSTQPFNTPAAFNGVSSMSYDVVHHVLYGAAGVQGLYRVVTY